MMKKKEIWQTYQIKKNDVIGFYGHINGLRAYLSVKDSFDIEKVQGSYARSYKEKTLKKGDFLPFLSSITKDTKRVASFYVPIYTDSLTVHILLGS